MISNFQVFVNNFFKFFIKQGYKDSNLEMTESESVALPFGDSPMRNKKDYSESFPQMQAFFPVFLPSLSVSFDLPRPLSDVRQSSASAASTISPTPFRIIVG